MSLRKHMSKLLIIAAAYGIFILAHLALHNFDASYFITAGDRFTDATANIHTINNSIGYDGQFYYRIALNPFSTQTTESGITLDNPPQRHQRILYPLIVWLLSLGNAQLIPWVMILVNLAAICLIAKLGADFAKELGLSNIYGLTFALFPGFLLSLLRDLTEPVSATLLLASLLLIRRNSVLLASLFLSLALLARESALLAVIAFLAWLLFSRNKGWKYMLIPLVVYAIWQATLFSVWGELPLTSEGGNFGLPFSGVVSLIGSLQYKPLAKQLFFLAELASLAVFTLATLASLNTSKAKTHEKLAWLFYCAFALFLTPLVWGDDWSFIRALTEFYLFGAIILLSSGHGKKLLPAAAGAWLLLLAVKNILDPL